MPEETRISHLEELTEDGHEVVTTVYQLGSVEIKLSRKAELALISVSGPYSPSVAREIEKVARHCPGSVGLEFIEASGPEPQRGSFDSSVLRLLKLLQAQCERRSATFFLCVPPPRLEDAIKLAGVHGKYPIVDRKGRFIGSAHRDPRPGSRSERRRERAASRPGASPLHAETAPKRIFQLNQSLKRTESLEKGLDSAERCVRKFLPQEPPEAEGYRFAFSYRSSEKVGGDFFDFFPLDGDRLAISIGDVSGHGIDSAIVMGISKKLIAIRARDDRFASPAEVLKQVNSDITQDLARQTFVTALYGVLELASGTFHFARAGHEPPILFTPGGPRQSVHSRGVALGLGAPSFFDSQIEDVKVRLDPGWCLLLSTDGLAECRNEKEAFYSRERLVFELGQIGAGRDARGILDHLLAGIQGFAGSRKQEDDMTAILVQRNAASERPGGAEAAARPRIAGRREH